MDEEEADLQIAELLDSREKKTLELYDSPYDIILYLQRAFIYQELGYPDLAAGDAYRALLLTDEVLDESFEYHDVALEALRPYASDSLSDILSSHNEPMTTLIKLEQLVKKLDLSEVVDEDLPLYRLSKAASIRCYQILSLSLLLCGCLKSSLEFSSRGLAIAGEDEQLQQAQEYVRTLARRRMKLADGEEVDINDLPNQGLVRREIYPWNDHEPDRYSDETLDFLNSELSQVAPKCEAKVTELPTLLEDASNMDSYENIPTNKQLGLFAKEDIAPGEIVLDEVSMLTANNRLKESLCDACSSPLPPLNAISPGVPCNMCDDTMFCSQACHDAAQEFYHPAICEKDIDTIAKDPSPAETPNALYLLLLARALAMSSTQEFHPLDLKEVKYIWGDFLPSSSNAVNVLPTAGPPPVWTLPFSFEHNISAPLHILEKMDIDIFATLEQHDLWVFNSLYAKFRGTASARVGVVDDQGRVGRGPEVAAVHPLWCLANHDCDPNVSWEWGGRMKLWAREWRIGSDQDIGHVHDIHATNNLTELADALSPNDTSGIKTPTNGSKTPTMMSMNGTMTMNNRRRGGIKAGEEILNHYCDIDLPVRQRREWAAGSLGGWCMCARCRREAATENEKEIRSEGRLVNGGS